MTVCAYSLKKYTGTCFKENCFSLKLFWIFSFKIDSTGINTITLDPDPDPNWAKILVPDPNSMHLDPQHCLEVKICTKVFNHEQNWKFYYFRPRLIFVSSYLHLISSLNLSYYFQQNKRFFMELCRYFLAGSENGWKFG